MKQHVSETGHESDSWCVNVFRDAHPDEEALSVMVREAVWMKTAGL